MSLSLPASTTAVTTTALATGTATSLLALTTPFVAPPDCDSLFSTTSIVSSFWWNNYTVTTIGFTVSDLTNLRFADCQPAGWGAVVPESRFSFSPAVCPSGWTAYNVAAFTETHRSTSATVTYASDSTINTAFCCASIAFGPGLRPRPQPVPHLLHVGGGGGGLYDWYLGVSALNMFHGQYMYELARGVDTDFPEDRVRNDQIRGANPLNVRTVPLTCGINTPPDEQNRWHLGQDRTPQIQALLENRRNTEATLATAINSWANNLYGRGAFTPRAQNGGTGTLNYIWPSVSRTQGRGFGNYNPEVYAFDANWWPESG